MTTDGQRSKVMTWLLVAALLAVGIAFAVVAQMYNSLYLAGGVATALVVVSAGIYLLASRGKSEKRSRTGNGQ